MHHPSANHSAAGPVKGCSTLYRLEDRGWIKGRWIEEAGQRRRCHYRITETGRRVLAEQRADWSRFIAALGQVAGVKFA